jgi:hypothetical protein
VPQTTIAPSIQCTNATLHPGAQGIKRVAVDDINARLTVVFLAPITPQQSYLFKPQSYSLTGGQRLFPRLLKAEPNILASPPGPQEPSVLLTLDGPGDFSIYTLTVSGPDIDPFFSSAKLRFRLACDEQFDCRTPAPRPTHQPDVPVVVDYLAKDYSSFRQALLDFIPTRLPNWTERSEADIGMMLLELFASTADNLSYLQDRVANEAFLTTATQRRSVAGHLALLGYQMDEGASAHTWLQFQVNTQQTLSGNPGFKVSNQPITSDEPVIVFETLGEAGLDPAHNQMALFDWGNSNCCLPSTALSAALAGSYARLKAGDYLLFDDGRGDRDVVRLNASPQVVSVTQVIPTALGSPPPGFVTIVNWSAATPLQNDYCVACTTVRGNLVPATHGETVNETLRSLTPEQIVQTDVQIAARQPWQRIPRQRLQLSNAPLAHLDPQTLSLGVSLPIPAAGTNQSFPGQNATPAARSISTLQLSVDGVPWKEQTSLLTALPDSEVFKVEIDEAGQATVVFGDGVFGQSPLETATVTATYRTGGGQNGNVGADTLTVAHPDVPAPWLISVTNPLPATEGRNLESGDHARRFGPPLSRQPLVAVSSADYQTAASAFIDSSGQQPVQRAEASFQWTGSWLTVTLAVDPAGTNGLTPALGDELLGYLASKRLAGYDLQITGPAYLPIDLEIQFSIAPGSQSSSVQETLKQALSKSVLPDGSKGFFHPDNFTFGQNLYVSKIFAAVMGVPGVQSAKITRLAPLHSAQSDSETAANLAKGFLAAGADQIIRLDNDRNFPQNGTLTVIQKGATT